MNATLQTALRIGPCSDRKTRPGWGALSGACHGLARRSSDRRAEDRDRFPSIRRGHALVELLMVVGIIGTLAGLVLGGLKSARAAAREAQTKATITKLHNIIMAKYDSYRTRRVTFTAAAATAIASMNRKDAAKARLFGLRDLVRMEMPERAKDIESEPFSVAPTTFASHSYAGPLVSRSAVSQAYCSRFAAAGSAMGSDASAKCLYLIVTMLCGARDQFKESEIAGPDKSGFFAFVDGWGRPIRFLRWAPGFNDSDLQPNLPIGAGDADRKKASDNDHDPLDPQRSEDPDASPTKRPAWRLTPLIYSAGPDGQYGIKDESDGTPYAWTNDTYTMASLLGTPSGSAHYDNIHNHRIEMK